MNRVQVLKFSSSWHLSPKGCNEVQQVVGIFFIFHLNGPWWFGISWITCWLSHLMFLDGVAGVLTTKKFEARSLDKSQKYIPCKSTTFVFNMFVHQLFFFPNVNLTMSSQTRCKICSWGKDHSSTKLWLQELASSPNEIIFAVVCKEVLQESTQCWRYRNSNWYDWVFFEMVVWNMLKPYFCWSRALLQMSDLLTTLARHSRHVSQSGTTPTKNGRLWPGLEPKRKLQRWSITNHQPWKCQWWYRDLCQKILPTNKLNISIKKSFPLAGPRGRKHRRQWTSLHMFPEHLTGWKKCDRLNMVRPKRLAFPQCSFHSTGMA